MEKVGGWKTLNEGAAPTDLIILAKQHLDRKLKYKWIPAYYVSDFGARYYEQSERTRVADVAEDAIALRNAHSLSARYAEIREHRWLYSSQSIIDFRKALRNNFTTKLLIKFITLKAAMSSSSYASSTFAAPGSSSTPPLATLPTTTSLTQVRAVGNLVNNLQFLLEVQEYKARDGLLEDVYPPSLFLIRLSLCLNEQNLCQQQSSQLNQQALLAKTKHIVTTFVDNKVAPRIRIDIPQEAARIILDQKDYLSPYLFQEANVSQFNQINGKNIFVLFFK